jgi:hypothetical protein
VASGMPPLSLFMRPSIAHELLDRFYSDLLLKTLSNLGRWSVMVKIPVPKIEILHTGLNRKNANFLRSVSKDFD